MTIDKKINEREKDTVLRRKATEQDYPLIPNAEREVLLQEGYELLENIGSGYTRIAYRAQFKPLGTTRILKRLFPHAISSLSDSSITATMNLSKELHRREVVSARKLNHPNLAEIIDQFEIGQTQYLVERDYHGIDLAKLVQMHGRLRDSERLFDIVDQLYAAISHMHSRECVHRDIKPENIIVDSEGHAFITDFQTLCDKNGRHSFDDPPGTTKGATAYTTPATLNRLLRGESLYGENEGDLNALGATLFFLLTGNRAFDYTLEGSEDPQCYSFQHWRKGPEHVKEVRSSGKTFYLQLCVRGDPVEQITPEMRARDLSDLRETMDRLRVARPWQRLVLKLTNSYFSRHDLGRSDDSLWGRYALEKRALHPYQSFYGPDPELKRDLETARKTDVVRRKSWFF